MRDIDSRQPQEEYDYLILGGGTAGCLLARLLAEADVGSVAIIEAGATRPDVRSIAPALYPRTFGSQLDWQFTTEPQPHLHNRRIAWPRGKILGGSSAINALIYLQAAEADFDRWSADGCAGWDWQSISRHLNKSMHPSECPVSGLPLSSIQYPHAWSTAFLQTCVEAGLARCDAWLQAVNQTCGLFTLTQRNARREHTGSQLSRAATKANLDVLPDFTVDKLTLSRDRVQAVELIDSMGHKHQVKVAGEVICCAGAIGSPCILQRSGIGPAELLAKAGIATQIDLPGVGANLQDHLVFPLIYRTKESCGLPARFTTEMRQQFRKSAAGFSHELKNQLGPGPLGSNIAEAGAMLSLGGSNMPDVQIHFTPTHYLKYPSSLAPSDHCSLAITDLHPRSRGQLSVRSADPQAAPSIDPAYLSHHEDGPRFVEAISRVREIAACGPLRDVILQEALPGVRRLDSPSILRSVEMFAMSIYHPVGSCRMGAGEMAVVDAALRVQGVSNLRIADASVLPDLPSANTQAVTLLVAWLASAMLLGSADVSRV